MIPDPEDEQTPKKQRKPVMATKIWVGNSCGIFKLFLDHNFEALKLSDYTFMDGVAKASGFEPRSFDTLECHLLDTVPRQQLTFRYDGCRPSKRFMPTIKRHLRQTMDTYAELGMQLQHFEVRVIPVFIRVPLDVPATMPNGNLSSSG